MAAGTSEDDIVRGAVVDVVMEHRALAVAIARTYRSTNVDGDDIEQVAMEGLAKAARDFDTSVGVPFHGYARVKIHGEIKRFMRDCAWDMRPPRPLHERHIDVHRAMEHLATTLSRSPTPADVAEFLGIPKDWVLEALDAGSFYRIKRLEAPTGTDGATVGADVGAPDGDFAHAERRALVRHLLERLDPRAAKVVRLHYLHDLGQEETAERLGLSQPTVSRILRRSLDQLKADASLLELPR